MRTLCPDGSGRHCDSNGTMEEKMLYYFYAHHNLETYCRGVKLDNEAYRLENKALREGFVMNHGRV